MGNGWCGITEAHKAGSSGKYDSAAYMKCLGEIRAENSVGDDATTFSRMATKFLLLGVGFCCGLLYYMFKIHQKQKMQVQQTFENPTTSNHQYYSCKGETEM